MTTTTLTFGPNITVVGPTGSTLLSSISGAQITVTPLAVGATPTASLTMSSSNVLTFALGIPAAAPGAAGLGVTGFTAQQSTVTSGQNSTVTVTAHMSDASTQTFSFTAPSGTNGSSKLDPTETLYNWSPTTQLANWKAAVMPILNGTAAQATRAKIVCLGDSTTYGIGSLPDGQQARFTGYPSIMTKILADYAPSSDNVCLGFGDGSDPRIVLGGSSQMTGINGAAGNVAATTQAGDTITFTLTPGVYDRVDVYMIEAGAASANVKIDGVDYGTLNAGTAGGIYVTTINLPRGTHSQAVFTGLAQGMTFIYGVVFWDSLTPSIEVYNYGQPGADSAGITNGTATGYTSFGHILKTAPNLCLINIGINDINNGTQTAAQAVTNLTPLITALKAQNCDVILIVPQPFASSNYATGIVQFRTVYETMATTLGIGLIDLSNYFNNANYPVSLWSNSLHPSATVYRQMASLYVKLFMADAQPAAFQLKRQLTQTTAVSGTYTASFAKTGDCDNEITLSANTTITFGPGNPNSVQTMTLTIHPASFTATLPTATNIKYATGSAPTLSTSADTVLRVTSIKGAAYFVEVMGATSTTSSTPSATSPTPIKRFSHAVAPFSEGSTYTDGAKIWGSVWSAESSFTAVRVILENYDTANPLVVTGLYVAPQANTDKTGFPQKDATAGNSSTWVPVTYNGSATITVPPAIGDKQGSVLITDLVYVQSVPRVDGSAQALLNVQTQVTNTTGYLSRMVYGMSMTAGGDGAAFNTAVGRMFAAYITDKTSAGQSLLDADISPTSLSPVRGVIFSSTHQGYTLLTPGDSLWCGAYGSAEGYQSTGFYAALALSTATHPVGFVGTAWGGMDSTTFFANGKVMFDALQPKLVLIPCGSPNDNGGPLGIYAQLAQAVDFYDYCTSRGALVMMATAIPWSTAGNPSIYQTAELSAAVRSLGIPILDVELLLNGSIPAPGTEPSVLAAYRGSDGIHLNDAGYKLLGQTAAASFKTLLGW